MRSVCILVLLILLVLAAPLAVSGALLQAPELSSIAYIVYDGDLDYLILEKNATQRRSIASITKVMTLFYTLELVEAGRISLDDQLTASAQAARREGTQIKLKAGDRFTLEELLYATALVSANDAAVAIAEYVAGSEAEFCRLMNSRAQELGLWDTHYVDCTGLLSIFSNNYSTALDQARLFKLAWESDLFRQIISTPEYHLQAQARKIENTHPLLDRPGVQGGKTGATTAAGHTLITSVSRNEKQLITVILGARSRDVRNEEAEALQEWAFGNLKLLIPKNQVLASVVIPDGVDYQINGVLAKDFSVVALSEGELDFQHELQFLEGLRAPVEKGAKLGELVVSRGGKEFARLDLVAQQGTGLASWLRRLFNRLWHFFKRR